MFKSQTNRKMFSVVQTKKSVAAKPELSVVPSTWLINNKVYWPNKNLVKLSRDGGSFPEPSWKPQLCKFYGSAATYEDAEGELRKLENLTDSDENILLSRGTRQTPAIKKLPNKNQFGNTFTILQGNVPSDYGGNNGTVQTKTKYEGGFRSSTPNTSPPDMIAVINDPFLNGNGTLIEGSVVRLPDGSLATITIPSTGTGVPVNDQEVLNELLNDIEMTEELHQDEISNETDQPFSPEDFMSMPVINQVSQPSIDERLASIEAKLDWQNDQIRKIGDFILNFEKLMTIRKPEKEMPQAKHEDEDFSIFAEMHPAKTIDELYALEVHLGKDDFCQKFLRYIKSLKKMDGKGNGKIIFREIMQMLVQPSAVLTFSWKGFKSTRNGSEMGSFSVTFPNLIKFVNAVVRLSDKAFVFEDTEDQFKIFLRYKNIENRRVNTRTGERRATSVRRKLNTSLAGIGRKKLCTNPENIDVAPDESEVNAIGTGKDNIAETESMGKTDCLETQNNNTNI